jgi:hypothetical protein
MAHYLATTWGDPTSQFGVVGNTAHVMGYHLGRDRIYTIPPGSSGADYSIQTARDKAGLSDAAAAIDIKFESDYLVLRRLSVWLQNARDQVYLVDLPGFGASAFALRQDCTFTMP